MSSLDLTAPWRGLDLRRQSGPSIAVSLVGINSEVIDNAYRRGRSLAEFGAFGLGGDDAELISTALAEMEPGSLLWIPARGPDQPLNLDSPIVHNGTVSIVGEHTLGTRLMVQSGLAGQDVFSFVRDTDSVVNLEVHVPGLELRNFCIDGNLRSVAVSSALRLHRFDRAKIDLMFNAVKGSALKVTHSLRESDVWLRTYFCADANNDRPTVDINQDFTDSSAEGSNLNFFHGVCAVNVGDQLRVRSANGVVARNMDFTDVVFHGLNEWVDDYVDFYGTPMTLDHGGNLPCRIVVDNGRGIRLDNSRLHLNGRGQPLFLLTDDTAGSATVNSVFCSGGELSYRGNSYTATSVTAVDTAADAITLSSGLTTSNHHLQTGSRVQFAGTSLPGGLAAATDYYAVMVDASHFKVADTRAHALAGTNIVDLASAGTAVVCTQYDTAVTVDAATDVLTAPSHYLTTGARFRVGGSVLPGGIANTTTDYYVIRVDADTLKLASTHANAVAGTAIDLTSTGTAVFLTPQDYIGRVRRGVLGFDDNEVSGIAPVRPYFYVGTNGSLNLGLMNSWAADATHPAVEYETGGAQNSKLWGALTLQQNNVGVQGSKADGTVVSMLKMNASNVVSVGDTNAAGVNATLSGATVTLLAGIVERFRANSTGVSFNGATAIAKPTITGTRPNGSSVALGLAALANYGLVTDSTTDGLVDSQLLDSNGHIPAIYMRQQVQQQIALRRTGALAETISRTVGIANLGAVTAGRITSVAIYLLKGTVVTGITFVSGTTAGATLTDTWFGLWDSSLALLGVTGDDVGTSWASNTEKTLNLASPYTVTADGLFTLGVAVNGGTMPTLAGAVLATGRAADTPKLAASTSASTYTNAATAPSPLNQSGAFNGYPYAYVT